VEADVEDVLLDDAVFTVLDVETTGLNPLFGDRVCEIALLRYRGGRELDRFHSLVNPGRPTSPGAFAVHGILDEDLSCAPLFGDIAPTVLHSLEDSIVVAHNAPFDLAFLAAEFERFGLPEITNVVVDTLALARRCYRFPSNSLGGVARFLGMDICGQHRALADVVTTRGILERFLADLAQKGMVTLGALLKTQGGPVGRWRRESTPLPPQIEEVLGTGRRLHLRYVSAAGEETVRIVTPLRVTARAGHLYLVAMCHLRNEQRSFRLDRIVEMDSAGDDHTQ